MTIEQMRAIDEENRIKFLVNFEYVSEDGTWQKASHGVNSLSYAELKIRAITNNDRTRNPIMITL